MELRPDDIATPQEEGSPEARYASLHRTIQRGMASPEVYRELVEVCLELGHVDEARRLHSIMDDGPTRDRVGSRLSRVGSTEEARAARRMTRQDHHEGSDHAEPVVSEHVKDALQFLCQSHMPAVALLTMLAFPVVVGIGGVLTTGGSPWLFAGLAALPGLCVLGVVGAMGRHTFLLAMEGGEAVPCIPAPTEMLHAARRHLTDNALVLTVLLAPSLAMFWLQAPSPASLTALVVGMSLVPIAMILRQSRGDLRALSPVRMLRGITRCRGYTKVTAAFWLAFTPAAAALWFSLDHALWLQVAIAGPLAVLPTFATARLLGTFTELHRWRLSDLLEPTSGDIVRITKLTAQNSKPRCL